MQTAVYPCGCRMLTGNDHGPPIDCPTHGPVPPFIAKTVDYSGPIYPGMITAVLPTDSESRNQIPLATGLLDYFPLALAEVARVSLVGNQQHNPGQPMHWAREKSTDHADKIMKHLVDRGTMDTDNTRHSGKVAWRALALLQTELEAEGGTPGRGSRFPTTKET